MLLPGHPTAEEWRDVPNVGQQISAALVQTPPRNQADLEVLLLKFKKYNSGKKALCALKGRILWDYIGPRAQQVHSTATQATDRV